MFKKAFVHIGQPKTATSTIQRFLFVNQNLLEKKGIIIPAFNGPNNTSIAFIAVSYTHLRAHET